MSKFFMYGSELQEIEQLMMLVPNFLPRRSGVIVVQRIRNEEVPSRFEKDYEHITAYCNSNTSSRVSNQIAGGVINYEEIICSCFEKCESHRLNVRFGDLIRNHDGEIFLTVDSVDDVGTLHMRWDNGRTLGIVPGEDQFRVIPESQEEVMENDQEQTMGGMGM